MTLDNPFFVLPGHFGSDIKNIKIVKNFFELDDIKKIQKFLPTINQWDDPGKNLYNSDGECTYDASYWRNRQCGPKTLSSLNMAIYNIVELYIKKMQMFLEDAFKVKLSGRSPVIIRWNPGTEQQPHADKQLNDGSPNPFPDYDINSLFYYNDDFSGGELYYPQYDLEIKPSPGLAVAHPGDIYYLHGVRKILSGQRYTTPSFYSVTSLTS